MKKHHDISGLKFEDNFLIVTIDGEPKKFDLKKISSALDKASIEQRNNFKISPSGYGIHWPEMDEDISIDGLLGVVHTPEWKEKTG
jgi:Protein of unknown function (DUF2442)